MVFSRVPVSLAAFGGAAFLIAVGCGDGRAAPSDDAGTGDSAIGRSGGRTGDGSVGVGGASGSAPSTGGGGGAGGQVAGVGGGAGPAVGSGGVAGAPGPAGGMAGRGTGGRDSGGAGGGAGTGGVGTGGAGTGGVGTGGVGTGGAGTGGASTGGRAMGTGGGSLGGAGGCGTAGPIATVVSTTTRLIDLFVRPEGIIVVSSDQVALYGRDRQLRRSVPFPREIVSAAIDGNLLVVADRAALTALTADLTMGPSVFVTETCVGSVLVSGGRLVCGPGNDWDRIFYTYNMAAAQPALLAMSAKYTYKGIPMRRVPGTDDFVTVSEGTSPSDFYLHRVGANGASVFINESPYHGDFSATRVFAFDGSPAKHLIQTAGLLLKLSGDGCNMMTNLFTSGCFTKDGALGTLQGSEYFLGMADDGAGKVYGVTSATSFILDQPCQAGCSFQRIDVATRTIETQKKYTVTNVNPFRSSMLVAPDAICNRILMGNATPGATSSFDVGGFQVQSFDL